MELLEMAYPEVTFSTPDARAMLTSVLAEWLDGRDGGTSGRGECPVLSFAEGRFHVNRVRGLVESELSL